MKRSTILAVAVAVAVAAVPLAPAAVAAADLVIEGGTVHPISGEAFVGRVVIADGRIAAVGPAVEAPAGAPTIDASGLHVWPGLFDATSALGLVEIGAVAATVDEAEIGLYNPHLRAATAIHPASALIPVTRANGITHSVVAPQSESDGVIAGQAALVQLAGWTVEEMAIDPSIAMVVTWPEIRTRSFDFSTFSFEETPFTEAKEKAQERIAELREWLEAALHYRRAVASGSDRVERDLRLEALAEVLDGGKKMAIVADAARDVEAALDFAEEEGLDVVLLGGREAWQHADRLAESGVPVVMRLTQSLPEEEDDPYDEPYAAPGRLAAAGVKIAFASSAGGGFGPGGPHGSRTTPYEAAQAVPFGLAEEDAMRALTLWPAEIWGVDDRLGSIEPGKIANLIVTDGSPLEITTRVAHVVIGGEEVPTANRHRELWERYRTR